MKQKRENLVKIDASNQAPQLMTTDKETAVYHESEIGTYAGAKVHG